MNTKIEKRGRFIIQEINYDQCLEADEKFDSLKKINNVHRCYSTNLNVFKIFHNEMDQLIKDNDSIRCEILETNEGQYLNFKNIWGEFTECNRRIKIEIEKDEIFKYEYIDKNEKVMNLVENGHLSESTVHDSSNEFTNDCSSFI